MSLFKVTLIIFAFFVTTHGLVLPDDFGKWRPLSINEMKCESKFTHHVTKHLRVLNVNFKGSVDGWYCSKLILNTDCSVNFFGYHTINHNSYHSPPSNQECNDALERVVDFYELDQHYPDPECTYLSTETKSRVSVVILPHTVVFDPISEEYYDDHHKVMKDNIKDNKGWFKTEDPNLLFKTDKSEHKVCNRNIYKIPSPLSSTEILKSYGLKEEPYCLLNFCNKRAFMDINNYIYELDEESERILQQYNITNCQSSRLQSHVESVKPPKIIVDQLNKYINTLNQKLCFEILQRVKITKKISPTDLMLLENTHNKHTRTVYRYNLTSNLVEETEATFKTVKDIIDLKVIFDDDTQRLFDDNLMTTFGYFKNNSIFFVDDDIIPNLKEVSDLVFEKEIKHPIYSKINLKAQAANATIKYKAKVVDIGIHFGNVFEELGNFRYKFEILVIVIILCLLIYFFVLPITKFGGNKQLYRKVDIQRI